MATIHQTSLVPGKFELLTHWMPTQSWFLGGTPPALRKAGGFRLDDPAGQVGIEVLIAIDVNDPPFTYVVPLTYRDKPVTGKSSTAIGTAEHGVLGTRYLYGAVADPVFDQQLSALGRGAVRAQRQSESDTVELEVVARGPVRADSVWEIVRTPDSSRRAVSVTVTVK